MKTDHFKTTGSRFFPAPLRSAFTAGLLAAALWLLLPVAHTYASATAQTRDEKSRLIETGRSLCRDAVLGGDVDLLIAFIPPQFRDSDSKKAAIGAKFKQRRGEILTWLGPVDRWELDLAEQRPSGEWKIRFRFYDRAGGSAAKPVYKTLYFLLRAHRDRCDLIYVGGWDPHQGSRGFWP